MFPDDQRPQKMLVLMLFGNTHTDNNSDYTETPK